MVVALRKESVDRNRSTPRRQIVASMSLSARRAWIEIYRGYYLCSYDPRSLSARRAWIEIGIGGAKNNGSICRSPQGERG